MAGRLQMKWRLFKETLFKKMDIIKQLKNTPSTNMQNLVSRWSTIMVPTQSARKRGRDTEEDFRPKTRAYVPSETIAHPGKSEIQGAPAPCKISS